MDKTIVKWLFETAAVRVCEPNMPFWYTSGKIGPFYINTHFLFGGEVLATAFLKKIDNLTQQAESCSAVMEASVLENLEKNNIYAGVIDAMVKKLLAEVPLVEIDAISGGERRDWFFSFAVAHRLNKPHVTLFKNGTTQLYTGKQVEQQLGFPPTGSSFVSNIQGKKVLHVADLITSASSYERAWVPAIAALGGQMTHSLVVVDRLQGGEACLNALGIVSMAMTDVQPALFQIAVEEGVLDASQLSLVRQYMKDPDGSMKVFLQEHPEFMAEALAGDEKTAQRARLCIDRKFYD